MKYNKISIIGISGSGKTTFSNVLSKIVKLPVFHVDRLFWRENGEPMSKADFTVKHSEIISQSEWIIEGYIEETMVERVAKSDFIIYLDYSRFVVLNRFIKRWIGNKMRDDLVLPEETFIGFLIKVFVETIIMSERRKIERTLKTIDKSKVLRIKNPEELNKFVNFDVNDVFEKGAIKILDKNT
jgi:adenylate kinase family enzyme